MQCPGKQFVREPRAVICQLSGATIMKSKLQSAACASLLTFFLTSAEAGETIFHFTSEPGDYIGQGQELTVTPADGNFSVFRNFQNGVSLQINNSTYPNPSTFLFWYADFAAPFTGELTPGVYEKAIRFPFNVDAEPGLSISGDGRGCNMLTGRFEVLEAIYDSLSGDVISFAADFEQHCEAATAPAMFGSIRINSDVPLPVLLPPRINVENALNSQNCVEGTGPTGAIVDLSASLLTTGNFVFNWTTSTGEIGIGPNFSFSLGTGVTAAVVLTATEMSSNDQVAAMTQVCVSDTTAPQITIHRPTEGQVVKSKNTSLEVSVDDAVDQEFDQIRVFVGHVADIPINSKKGRVRTKLPPGNVGPNGTMTEIIVEATDDSGNTGRSSVNILYQQGAP
jgi:hypothetical protein